MTAMLASTPLSNSAAKIPQTTGIRKNGKTWKDTKAPFRKTTSTPKNAYAKRVERQSRETAVKAAEKQLKAEKDEEREVSIHQDENEDWVPPTSKFWGYQNVKDWDRKFWGIDCIEVEEEHDNLVLEEERRVQAIKDRRAAKEERERFELMEQKMHRKRVERVKRREKRNKLLKS